MSDNKEKQDDKEYETPEEVTQITQHTVEVDGKTLNYTVTTGTIVLHEEIDKEGTKAKATIFYIAYTLDDQPEESRPITFSFNGGPGSSSVWLHLGLLGPRRVLMDDEGNPLPPPYKLVDNEYSLLDKSDLVFIDPVSTGYSRAVPGEDPRQFHDYDKDIEWVSEFIRVYMSRNKRWSSPKFLIGESYGTTRAGGVVGHLQERHGMYFNGVMLVSSVLNFQTLRFNIGNELPYIFFLPTYAATAWYHNQIKREHDTIEAFLAEVEAFASGDYTVALMQGNKLSAEKRAEVVSKLAKYTGLSETYIERTNLRIEIMRFTKELMREKGRTVGRLDSRFQGVDADSAGERFEYDPSYATIQGTYTGTFNDYVRRELEYESDLPYEILTYKVWPWSYKSSQNEYLNVAETLRKAMTQNPHLQVFVANGYYDLATPYFATEYTFSHLNLDEVLAKNISMAYYHAGHMMYVHLPSLAKLKSDLAAFVHQASYLD